jgi:hypothetical protein
VSVVVSALTIQTVRPQIRSSGPAPGASAGLSAQCPAQ